MASGADYITLSLSWQEFKAAADRLSHQGRDKQRQYIFRGQARSDWPLLATIDRPHVVEHTPSLTRQARLKLVLEEFRLEARGLGIAIPDANQKSLSLEMLARHHGAPTSLLDWTRNMYIAAFFAFDDDACESTGNNFASVWLLDREVLPDDPSAAVELFEDDPTDSIRAIEQQAVFLRATNDRADLRELLGAGLRRIDIPVVERAVALRELAFMDITARSLFRDLDGAARTVRRRLLHG